VPDVYGKKNIVAYDVTKRRGICKIKRETPNEDKEKDSRLQPQVTSS
jgi:uncharacterized protein (UPF0335 family)